MKKSEKIDNLQSEITALHKQLAMHHDHERILAAMFSNLRGMYYRCLPDSQWTMKIISDGVKDLTGYRSEELIDNTVVSFRDLIHAADREMVNKEINKAIKKGHSYTLEYRIIAGNNTVKWVWEKGQLVLNEDDNTAYLEGFITDITDRKLATEKVARNEAMFRNLIENSIDAVYLMDENGKMIDVNSVACSMLNRSYNELISLSIDDIDPNYPSKAFKHFWSKKPEGETLLFETVHVSKDGTRIPVEVNGIAFTFDGKKYLYGVARNLTERKKAQHALVESEKKYRTLFDSMNQGVVFQDHDGTILEANKAAQEILGLPVALVQGKTIPEISWRIVREDGSAMQVTDHPVMETYRTGEALHNIVIGIDSPITLEMIWLRMDTSPIFTEGNPAPDKVFSVFSDITKQKKAEEQLYLMNETLEKRVEERTSELLALNKELEAFAYTISHDLRAPLRAINGFTRILCEEYHGMMDAEGKHLCEVILGNTLKMARLIDDLLAFSRLGRSEMIMTPVDQNHIITQVYRELTTGTPDPNVVFTLDTLPVVNGDYTMLKQVWTNLIDNSLKFTSLCSQRSIHIFCTRDKEELTFHIRDNGAGFDMKYAAKLFGVFQRLHNEQDYPGTGVGLAIVQRIIQRLGGRIWAEGEVNKGSTFHFVLRNPGLS